MFESLNRPTVWIIISTWKTTNQSPTFAGVSQSLRKPPQRITGSGFEIIGFSCLTLTRISLIPRLQLVAPRRQWTSRNGAANQSTWGRGWFRITKTLNSRHLQAMDNLKVSIIWNLHCIKVENNLPFRCKRMCYRQRWLWSDMSQLSWRILLLLSFKLSSQEW